MSKIDTVEVLRLMNEKWGTKAKKAALQAKYGWSPSYMSYMFSGKKPPSRYILTELGLRKTMEVMYVRVES